MGSPYHLLSLPLHWYRNQFWDSSVCVNFIKMLYLLVGIEVSLKYSPNVYFQIYIYWPILVYTIDSKTSIVEISSSCNMNIKYRPWRINQWIYCAVVWIILKESYEIPAVWNQTVVRYLQPQDNSEKYSRLQLRFKFSAIRIGRNSICSC